MNKIDAISPMKLAWLLRADLRRGEPADSPMSEWFQVWWAIIGRVEYPAWRGKSTGDLQHLLKPLPNWPQYGAFGMTPALRGLIEFRQDLADAFNVSTEQGLWAAIAWFYVHGVREYGLAPELDAGIMAALDATPPFFEPVPNQPQQRPPLTWLMFFVWRCSADLQRHFDLRNPETHAGFLEWFLFEGVANVGLAPLVATRWRTWLQQPMGLHKQAKVAVPLAGCLLWQRRQDLQKTFDLRQETGVTGLTMWTMQALRRDPALRWIREQPDQSTAKANTPAVTANRPFGLNLIGFAFGELGIGEDVRMAVAACEAAGIPFAVVNIHPGDKLRQADTALASHVKADAQGEEAPYAANLFCLTGFDTVRVALERGASLFAGRKNIGWWPWELPVWPRDWLVAFDVIDEVWAATEFTKKMYTEAAALASPTPTPVVLMPMPASVARVKPMTRKALGLPKDQFLFLYVFDFNSYLARKNPFAAIKAFAKAFAPEDQSVGLVLKTMNSNPLNPEWRRFVRKCKKDARIVLLDKTLERGEVLGLIQSCDAYLSLHRSEGLGRTLAEAMLFGKPVVGTNFSGNVDFLTSQTGFPVQWASKRVLAGEYPFVTKADQAWWAEPNINDACMKMVMARKAGLDGSFAAQVKNFSATAFSEERVGALMIARLRETSQLWERT